MKRLLLLFPILLLLIACTKNDESERLKIEELSNESYNIVLIENEHLTVELLDSVHERSKDLDSIIFTIELTNKRDRTIEYRFQNMKLDGDSDVIAIADVNEIGPNKTIQFDVSVIDTSHLNFEEYISGELHYNDYTSDIPTDKEAFSEYIN